jgi:two-component system, NarL family, sensor histidine kinase UhpB
VSHLGGAVGEPALAALAGGALLLGLGALLWRLHASRDALARNEARYRRLFAGSPDGIIVRQGERVVLANPAAERLAGVAPGALLGRRVSDFVAPDDRAAVEERAARVERAEPVALRARRRILRADGTFLHCETETIPSEHQGAPAALVVVRDVTEQVRLEVERERLERTLHVLVVAGEVLLHAETEAQLTEGFCRAAVEGGGLLAAFVGLSDGAAGAPLRLAGQAGADPTFAAAVAARLAQPGDPASVTARALASIDPVAVADLREVEATPSVIAALGRGGRSALSLPLPWSPEGRGLLGMVLLVSTEPGFFDPAVTARLTPLAASLGFAVRSLRRRAILRGFLDHAPLSMFVFDPDGRILELNAHWERLTRRAAGELRGRLLTEVFSPELAESLTASNRQVLESGAPLRYPSRFPTAAGELDFEVTKFPISVGGKILGVAGVALEVSAQREAERALLASREAYRALAAHLLTVREDEQARISRDLHDDLGQLLTGVQLQLHLLEQRLAAEAATSANGALLDGVVAAEGLALEAAEAVRRVASGLRPGALDHLGLGAALLQAGRHFELQTRLPCAVEVMDPLPPVEAAIATTAWRIAQEALTNVARHARARSVRVSAGAQDDRLTLIVSDDGVGLPAGPPTGLGLLGMRERAEAVGGTFDLAPGPGGGTVVRASLPLRPQPPA